MGLYGKFLSNQGGVCIREISFPELNDFYKNGWVPSLEEELGGSKVVYSVVIHHVLHDEPYNSGIVLVFTEDDVVHQLLHVDSPKINTINFKD